MNIVIDLLIYLFALSLLFFISDWVQKSRNAKRMGTGLLSLVWALQSSFFLTRMLEHDYLPVFSVFETMFFFSWVLVTFSLVMYSLFRYELLLYVINIIGFAVFLLGLASRPSEVNNLVHWAAEERLLTVHVSLALSSYACFTVSAVFSGMYLFVHNRLKTKKWSTNLIRLPSLERIDQLAFRFAVVGWALLMLALMLGVAWIIVQADFGLLSDPKVIGSLAVVVLYAAYMFQRIPRRLPGHLLAFWNLGIFAFVVINFAVLNFFSGFHHWGWM